MLKKLLRGGAWVLVGQAGTAISQILIAVLLARMLAPDEYGAFQVVLRIVVFGAVIASFGMGWCIVREVADALARGNNFLARLQVNNILAIVVLCSVVFDLLYFFYGSAVSFKYFHIDLSNETYLITALVFLTAMQQVLPEGFRGMHNLKLASLLSGPVVNVLFLLGLLGLSLLAIKIDLTNVLWVLSISTLLVAAISFLNLQRKLADLTLSSDQVEYPFAQLSKENFRAGISFTATNIVNFFVNQADVWIVAAYFSVQDAAYYAAASRLAFLMSAPAMLANGTIRPTIVALWSADDKVKLESVLRIVATGSVGLTIVPLIALLLVGGDVMQAFFGSTYRSGGNVLFIISLGWFSLLMFGPAATLMLLVGKQKQYFYCTLGGAGVFFAAVLILPVYFSVEGVAIAVTLGMIANSLFAAMYVWRVMGVKTFCFLYKKV